MPHLPQTGRRIAFFGFDAFCPELAQEWASAGYLPNCARLLTEAAWCRVENPEGIEAGSVWPTVVAGTGPDRHGQFDGPHCFDAARYQVRVMEPEERLVRPFYAAASDAGRRVAIVDVPYVFLEPELNGVQVTDWLTHVRVNPQGLATYPTALAAELSARYGVNPFGGPNRCPTNECAVDTPQAIDGFRKRLLARIRWKLQLTLELLSREPWDLLMSVFHDAHDAGHMLWQVHDVQHERHDAEVAAAVGNPLRDVYTALDAALGRLMLAAQESGMEVLVYFSHGMGPDRSGTGFLDEILERLEIAYRGHPAPTLVDRLAPLYRALVPPGVRRRLVATPVIQNAYRRNYVDHLQERRFFELTPNHATGGVRINLEGRERNGIVHPGEEYEALCARLTRDLGELTNPETGEPFILSVLRTERLYPATAARMPDLLLEWNKVSPIERVHSPLFGVLERRDRRVRTGDHVQKRGALFRTRTHGREQSAGSITAADVAPTVAALMGLPTEGFTGRPWA
jgi:predicted AlkP superfamily phosphohydrolase/phosphomutase